MLAQKGTMIKRVTLVKGGGTRPATPLLGKAKPHNPRHFDTIKGGGNMVGDRVKCISSGIMIAA